MLHVERLLRELRAIVNVRGVYRPVVASMDAKVRGVRYSGSSLRGVVEYGRLRVSNKEKKDKPVKLTVGVGWRKKDRTGGGQMLYVGQLSTPFKRTAVTFDFRASESGLAPDLPLFMLELPAHQ